MVPWSVTGKCMLWLLKIFWWAILFVFDQPKYMLDLKFYEWLVKKVKESEILVSVIHKSWLFIQKAIFCVSCMDVFHKGTGIQHPITPGIGCWILSYLFWVQSFSWFHSKIKFIQLFHAIWCYHQWLTYSSNKSISLSS